MRTEKGVLLFEVTFVVLLTAIISLYLFRGYAVFLKAEKKALNYLELLIFSEQKIWDIESSLEEYNSSDEAMWEGEAEDFSWSLDLRDIENDEEGGSSDLSGLQRAVLRVGAAEKNNTSLDMLVYLKANQDYRQ